MIQGLTSLDNVEGALVPVLIAAELYACAYTHNMYD